MATTTQTLDKSSPSKANFVAQLKNFKVKFPRLATNFVKRLSFCSSPQGEERKEFSGVLADPISPKSSPKQLFKFNSEVCMIPHPSKRMKGGDDAYFVTENGLAIGVADGVGGWADKGVDPSLYSKTLMREAKHAYEELDVHDPLQSLKHATAKANKIMGSATACILSIDDAASCLRSANLGDSGFLLIRDGDIIHRTKEQQFQFNFPYQLGPTSRAQPKDADLASLELREGDKIVLGTDGLFDNLFDYEILQIVNKPTPDCPNTPDTTIATSEETKAPESPHVADLLANRAAERSRSTLNTPFSQHAKANGMKVLGGKMDDITVLFATVTSAATEDNDSVEINQPLEDSPLC